MATKQDTVRILELKLAEQRNDYDFLEKAYESTKVKNITFLAAGLALLGYLYTTTNDGNLKNKLFIPDQPYGVIIYAISAFLFLSALAALLYALRPRKWSTAYDDEQEEILAQQDYEFYLRYMSRRYARISKTNGASYKAKQVLLDMSLLPLVIGGILLLVLKTFGG
jgi:hypothetical protein